MAERITGGQATISITGANSAGASILPAGLVGTIDNWSIKPQFTYEDHNEIGNPRTVRQQSAQVVKVAFGGGVTDDTSMALAARQSAFFLQGHATPKYHIRVTGAGSDGSFDRTVKYCTLDDGDLAASGGAKSVTKALNFTGEEID